MHGTTIGFIGLGKIGGAMANNLSKAGADVVVYDPSADALAAASEAGLKAVANVADVASSAQVVFSALPNDKVLRAVSDELLPAMQSRGIHVSCSTVLPMTSKDLSEAFSARDVDFVAAPVFARPDGMQRGEATIPISGPSRAKAVAKPLLEKTALGVHDFGEEPGAANVVKLCGNFLIASAIEAMAEASALADSHGVDREQVIGLLNTTIFDCLIYRGYGHRVAARDHAPYKDAHFSLELGAKDVKLVNDTAAHGACPMPLAKLLSERFSEAEGKGWKDMDWSAIGLLSSQHSGKDVSAKVAELLAFKPEK